VSGTKYNPVLPSYVNIREREEVHSDVVDEVLAEMVRQDRKWGEQNHSPARWLAILAEEFGEVAKEVVGLTWGKPTSANYRYELIQNAAVSVRMVESYDRNPFQRPSVEEIAHLIGFMDEAAMLDFKKRVMTDPLVAALVKLLILGGGMGVLDIPSVETQKRASARAKEAALSLLSKNPPGQDGDWS
jgi:hypothetical protein